MPFFLIYFIVLVFSLFKWLQTVAYWKRLNIRMEVKFKENVVFIITSKKEKQDQTDFLNVFHFVFTFCQKLFFMNLKNKQTWIINMGR